MDVKPLQPLKVWESIDVTKLGMTILARLLQPANADLPILIIELGIVTFSN